MNEDLYPEDGRKWNGSSVPFEGRAGQGFTMGGHTNTTSEQQLVLEGEIHSGGQTFGRGSYRFIPRSGSHELWTCGEEAVLFVTRD